MEDVIDCITGTAPSVWFTSSDESAAREYIYYCAEWAAECNAVMEQFGNPAVFSPSKNRRVSEISFTNGSRITALSSNPKAFRSKGGKVCIDEFAHHPHDRDLWKAAKPAITWGHPLRILSTHNTKNSLYYKFLEAVKQGSLPWSRHYTDIYTAVQQGLLAAIKGTIVTPQETEAWLAALRTDTFDEGVWLEEYCCLPADDAQAFLNYSLLQQCTGTVLERAQAEILPVYAGIDIARKKDLTVVWLIADTGDEHLRTVELLSLKNAPFAQQLRSIKELISLYKVKRVCIDATGIGLPFAEELTQIFGRNKIESVTFTLRIKEELAWLMRRTFEEGKIIIPDDAAVREDLQSVRRVTTIANNIRFDVAATQTESHADRFWALALALHAAASMPRHTVIMSGQTSPTKKLLKKYHQV